VGEVVDVGAGAASMPPPGPGDRVFVFAPHATHHVVERASLWPVPRDVTADDAALFATLETALAVTHDAAPLVGERVVVVGQGVVGLACTALLAHTGPAVLVTVDRLALRRQWSLRLGATHGAAPGDRAVQRDALGPAGADLVVEASGDPAGLDLALDLAGPEGRVVVASWYGTQEARLALGTAFHRKRLRVISSQVSQVAPALRGRWDKQRRRDAVATWAPRLGLGRLITHRLPLDRAPDAYRLLDEQGGHVLQLVLTYPGERA
jgi:threonine dehydrogenase-like Zn-dependent dehydrogenase